MLNLRADSQRTSLPVRLRRRIAPAPRH